MRLALILCFLVLSACSTPQQRCVNSATSQISTIDRLIAETEQNLARGYTYILEPVPFSFGIGFCTGGSVRYCGSNRRDYRRRAVAIDADVERRKLASLKTQRAELASGLATRIEACGVRVIES